MTQSTNLEMEYTNRAYRQDMNQAMHGDIILALIELITNVDDAYRVLDRPGKIWIQVQNLEDQGFVNKISVSDSATGLSGEKLIEKMTTIGGMNEEHQLTVEGLGTRGLFGRGAKDVASFGKVRFESVKDGKYSSIEILGDKREWNKLAQDEPVTPEACKQMHLGEGENGLTAHIFVSKRSGTKIPGFKSLVEKLTQHVSLREIVAHHDVSLHDHRANQNQRLDTYPTATELVIDKDCTLDGYDGEVKLRVWRLPARDNNLTNEYSQNGLVVKDLRANYMNSFFTLDHRAERTWFHGEIFAPEIDELNRAYAEFDEKQESFEGDDHAILKKNPRSLVLRARNGLEKNHPYYRALAQMVQQELTPIFDEVAKADQGIARAGENLRKKLDSISRSLGHLIQEALDEADVDEEFGGGDGLLDARLFLLPPKKHLKRGQSAILKLWVPRANFNPTGVSLQLLECDDAIVLESDVGALEWTEHPRIEVMTASVRVRARDFGETTLTATFDQEASVSKLICESPKDDPIELPLELEWQRDTYRIAPTRSQRLRVIAPIELLGEIVSFETKSPLLSVTESAQLVLHSSEQYCGAEISVSAGRIEGNAEVIARCGGVGAISTVRVKETQPKRGPKIEHEVLNQDGPARSGLVPTPDLLKIQIFAKHRAMRLLIGAYDDKERRFKNEDSAEVHMVLAEIIATEAANYVIQKELENDRSRYRDAASIIARQIALLPRFLVPLQIDLLSSKS